MNNNGQFHKPDRGFYEMIPFADRYRRNGRNAIQREELIDVESTSFDSRFTSERPPPQLSASNINFDGPVFYQEQLKSQQEPQPRKRGRPRNPQVDIYNRHFVPIGRAIYEGRTARKPIHLETDDSIRGISFVKSIPEFHALFPPRYRAPGGPTYSQILAGQRMATIPMEAEEEIGSPYYTEEQPTPEVLFEEHYSPSISEKLDQHVDEPSIQRIDDPTLKPKEIWARGPGGKKYIIRLVRKEKQEESKERQTVVEKPRPLPPILMKRDVTNNEAEQIAMIAKRSRKEKHIVSADDPENTISARIIPIRKRQPDEAYLISEQELMGSNIPRRSGTSHQEEDSIQMASEISN